MHLSQPPIPFVDLRWQHEVLADELRVAVDEVFASSSFTLGPAVERFEHAFASYCGSEHGVACSSGTAAVHLALRAIDVGPGDEVITVAHTFVGTVWGILYCDAGPVFVDVCPGTMLLDATQLEAAITERTRAIIAVHLYGHPVDMDAVMEVAQRHGLAVIEDAAQAHGARYRGRRVGGIGDFGCFSFYPGKNLGAVGEGGAVVTADATHAARLRRLRDHGQEHKHTHEILGYNYRMDGIQGAVLAVKLQHLDRWNVARRRIAARYRARLAGLPDLILPVESPWAEPVYHLFVVRHPRRDVVRQALAASGVSTGVHYPTPVHRQPALAPYGPFRALDNTESAARNCFSLPVYPGLTDEAVDRVCTAVGEAVGAGLDMPTESAA